MSSDPARPLAPLPWSGRFGGGSYRVRLASETRCTAARFVHATTEVFSHEHWANLAVDSFLW